MPGNDDDETTKSREGDATGTIRENDREAVVPVFADVGQEEPTIIIPPEDSDETDTDRGGGDGHGAGEYRGQAKLAKLRSSSKDRNSRPSQGKYHRRRAKLAKLQPSKKHNMSRPSSALRGQAKLRKLQRHYLNKHLARTTGTTTGEFGPPTPRCRGQAKLNKLEEANQRRRKAAAVCRYLRETNEHLPARRLGNRKNKEEGPTVPHGGGGEEGEEGEEEEARAATKLSQAFLSGGEGMHPMRGLGRTAAAPSAMEGVDEHERNPIHEEMDSSAEVPLVGAIRVRQNRETGSIQATQLSARHHRVLLEESDISVEGNASNAIQLPPPAESLVRANPIEESAVEDLPVAQEFAHDQGQPKHRWWTIVYFGLGLLLVVGVPVLIFSLVRNASSSDNSGGTKDGGSSEGMDEMDIQDYVLALLPHYSVAKIDAHYQTVPPTPQTQAFQWILSDPSLSRYPDWRIIQRFALSTLFFATDGENWHKNTDWLSYDVDETYWHSSIGAPFEGELNTALAYLGLDFQDLADIIFENDEDELSYLLLGGNGLNGELPEEFFLLSTLRVVDLHRNKQLGGTLSTQIGKFEKLEIFAISSNEFSGTIPSELGRLQTLMWMYLLGNFLTGTIPTEVGVMPIWYLGLDSNLLTGPVPSEVGLMPYLVGIYLFENLLSSTLPSEIGQTESLNQLYLFGNQITGTIPTEIFSAFRKPDMTYYVEIAKVLYPNLKALVRGIPVTAIMEAAHASQLLIQRNQFGGPIPTQVGRLGDLDLFAAHSNQLTGPIPTELGINARLELLSLYDNFLSAAVPPELGFLLDLKLLALHGNLLFGTVPSQLGTLRNLEVLTLSQNLLTGSIPNELVKLSKLNILWMADNSLSSNIPIGLDVLFAGEVPPCCAEEGVFAVGAELDLSRNLLSGPFPRRVGPKLVRLAVESNRLTGTISRDLGNNGWLAHVDAGHNLITGTLSGEIASWPALKSFNVTSNLLSGRVPSEIGVLLQGPSSTMFDLSNNSFDPQP